MRWNCFESKIQDHKNEGGNTNGIFQQAVSRTSGGSGEKRCKRQTDVGRFNYGFVHGSKTKIGNLIVGWNEEEQTIVVLPAVPDLSGCGDPTYYRRDAILKAYRNKCPTDAFIIYPDKKAYIGINAYDWLDDEKLYVYVSQEKELADFTDFFMNRFAKK